MRLIAWTAHTGLYAVLAGQALAGNGYQSENANASLTWGPYRSNLYFGIRARLPKSLSLGMLWARTDEFEHISPNIRYTCEQHEGMAGYGWDSYDPRRGGSQVIHDRGNDIDIETTFLKSFISDKRWVARIKGTPSSADVTTSVWFTVAMEGLGSLEVDNFTDDDELGFSGPVSFYGQTPDLGEFSLRFVDAKGNNHPFHTHTSYDVKPLDRTFVQSIQAPDEATWQGKAVLYNSIRANFEDYVKQYGEKNMPPPFQVWTIPNRPGQGNVHLVEKVFQGPFEFDIMFTPSDEKPTTREQITSRVSEVKQEFDTEFQSALKPLAPYAGSKYLDFSKSLFSNLVGGIGYFYGDQLIDRSYAPEYEELNEGFWQETEEARAQNQQKLEGPYELFTAVPSRPFFPRGFLWDEGFHLLPVIDFDLDISMQIIHYWLNTMDDDGWIAREQILGQEARTKVPQEFQTQYPHYANPPTLFMAVEAIIDKVKNKQIADTIGNRGASAEVVDEWLRKVYPRLKKNFRWYRRTQFGEITTYDREAFSSKEAYRWRGRTPRHILTSGLDDYPRPQPPHPGELHVDLISWMGMAARVMTKIATHLDEQDDIAEFSKIKTAIYRNIDDLHWDATEKTYCDATIDAYEEHTHVCHKGYISLFPFMTGIVGADHEHLKSVLDLVADEEELWSPHGIRSLSKKDAVYGTDENYWRSPVWINMNYLIVDRLHAIATTSGPQQKRAATMFSALRRNLVDTVYNSWKETGFAWEQYNPETGAGQRTQHFTGWTSLVSKIMALPDLSGKQIRDEL